MQTGEAERLLRQAQMHAPLIAVKRQQLEALNAFICRITPLMGGGGVVTLEQLRDELCALTERWSCEVQEAQRLLDKLQDPAFAEVLNRRYFLNQTWDTIADKMYYSRRGVCCIHGRALAALDDLLLEVKQNEKSQ